MQHAGGLVKASLSMNYATSSQFTAGRLWLLLLGVLLALAGIVFTWVLWTAWQRAEETRRWVPAACRIVVSKVTMERPTPNSNPAYRPDIRYSYAFSGGSYTGTRLKRVDSPSQHQDVVIQRLQPWPPGSESTCFVNPSNPGMAVLKHDTRAALYSIWFPLLFVVGGLRMAWGALRSRRPEVAEPVK